MKKIIIPVLLVIVLVLLSCTGCYIFFLGSNPQIYPDDSYTGTLTADYAFPFKNSSVTLSVSIPASTYYGAVNSGSKYIPYTKIATFQYYSDIINDPYQDELYQQILDQTDTVKRSRDLTDDEYVELLTTFVQSIPYTTIEVYRYPVETIIDKYGDCDDKSMLLTGLLTRAGYDAVLLVFEEESHATVGIKTTDTTAYPNTGGYAIIETTSYSYVTDGSFRFEDGTTLTSTPAVVHVSEGTKTYGSWAQVDVILDYRDKASSMIDQLSSESTSNTENLELIEETVTGYETRLDALISLMDAALSEYYSYIDQANEVTAQQNQLNRDYNANKISFAEYSRQWDILDAKHTELLATADAIMKEYNAYHAQYKALYVEYGEYFSTYTSTYANYSSTVNEQNWYVDIYNLIITEPYNRQYIYQIVLDAPSI